MDLQMETWGIPLPQHNDKENIQNIIIESESSEE